MRALFAFLLLSMSAPAAIPEVRRDLFYTEANDPLQLLDVYAPAAGENHPVIVWVHGGGWRQGNKAPLQRKPQAFVEKGFVLVSINYRFLPAVTLKEMMGDVAKAIRWTREHAKEFRGDGETIVVMGHSAGAHLAALVCTDDRYLKAEGVPMSVLKGCVPVDVAVYDLPRRLKDGGSHVSGNYAAVMGRTEAEQRDSSPVYHVAKGKQIPPFLILYVASREDAKDQSQWLAEKLKEAGITARAVGGEGKTHGTINSELGLPDDRPTREVWSFLREAGLLKQAP